MALGCVPYTVANFIPLSYYVYSGSDFKMPPIPLPPRGLGLYIQINNMCVCKSLAGLIWVYCINPLFTIWLQKQKDLNIEFKEYRYTAVKFDKYHRSIGIYNSETFI